MDAEEYNTQLILNNNYVDTRHKQIKQEYNSKDIGIKVEPSEGDANLHVRKDNQTAESLHKDLIVKQELASNPEIIGEALRQYIKKEEEIFNKATDDLYKDHIIIKDELVIGPELLQKMLPPTSIACKGKEKCDPKKKCCSSFDNNEFNNFKCLYTCDYCGKTFNCREKIKQHINQHIPNENKCHYCGKCFSFKQNLARHLTIHSGKKPHKCVQCNATFSRKDYLTVHIWRHHTTLTQGEHTRNGQREKLICEMCNKWFASKCGRDHHVKFSCPKNKDKIKQQRNKLYVCDVCNKSYTYRTSLAAHIKRRHMNERVDPQHECDYCSKKYMKKHNLQCHMLAQHLNMKPYKCKICKETFTWHSSFSSHMRKEHCMVKKTVILF